MTRKSINTAASGWLFKVTSAIVAGLIMYQLNSLSDRFSRMEENVMRLMVRAGLAVAEPQGPKLLLHSAPIFSYPLMVNPMKPKKEN